MKCRSTPFVSNLWNEHFKARKNIIKWRQIENYLMLLFSYYSIYRQIHCTHVPIDEILFNSNRNLLFFSFLIFFFFCAFNFSLPFFFFSNAGISFKVFWNRHEQPNSLVKNKKKIVVVFCKIIYYSANTLPPKTWTIHICTLVCIIHNQMGYIIILAVPFIDKSFNVSIFRMHNVYLVCNNTAAGKQ